MGFSPVRAVQAFFQESAAKFADSRYRDRLEYLENENWRLQEGMSRLELDIENEGWYRLADKAKYTFDRTRLLEIVELATQMAIKNPITNRTVNIQADYVFGRGVRITSKNPEVSGWVTEFLQHRENRKTFTSSTAMRHNERKLQIQGSLFFVLFTNNRTGRVLVRTLDLSEVDDIIRDPEDYQRSLYIKRSYVNPAKGTVEVVYHPICGVTDKSGVKQPWEYGTSGDYPVAEIMWDAPVYVLQFNRFGQEKFAVPETYPQLDWCLSYKGFLEDWTSIMRSFARMCLKITGLSGKKQAAATKKMLGTTVSLANTSEKNPSGTASQISLLGKGIDIEAVKTAGATTPAKEGLPVLNMAASAAGYPSMFYGDASLAKNDVLDRPVELKILARQDLWVEAINDIIGFVVWVRGCKEYPPDDLSAKDPFTNEPILLPSYPADFDSAVEVIFPNILERNVTDRVRALVNAVTLFGKQLTDIIPDKRYVCRLLMEALDIPDIEPRLDEFVKMWEKNMSAEPGKPVDPLIIPPAPMAKGGAAEDPSQGGDVGANG